ncbi:uncharacterized protein METZ01_LOCUS432583, partial [marine metagenome]
MAGEKIFPGKNSAKPVEDARAVSELVGLHSHAVEEGEVEVAQGGFLGGPDAASWAQSALSFAREDEGQVAFRVTV